MQRKKSKKTKKRKKNKKRKRVCFPVVLDKMCVFSFYPIPVSQQRVKRGSCRCPILSGLLFVFLIFVEPWAHLCQGSSLGIEPIPLCCLSYLLSRFAFNCLSFLLNFLYLNILHQKCRLVSCRVKCGFMLCRFVFNYVSYFKYFIFKYDSY